MYVPIWSCSCSEYDNSLGYDRPAKRPHLDEGSPLEVATETSRASPVNPADEEMAEVDGPDSGSSQTQMEPSVDSTHQQGQSTSQNEVPASMKPRLPTSEPTVYPVRLSHATGSNESASTRNSELETVPIATASTDRSLPSALIQVVPDKLVFSLDRPVLTTSAEGARGRSLDRLPHLIDFDTEMQVVEKEPSSSSKLVSRTSSNLDCQEEKHSEVSYSAVRNSVTAFTQTGDGLITGSRQDSNRLPSHKTLRSMPLGHTLCEPLSPFQPSGDVGGSWLLNPKYGLEVMLEGAVRNYNVLHVCCQLEKWSGVGGRRGRKGGQRVVPESDQAFKPFQGVCGWGGMCMYVWSSSSKLAYK